MRSFAKTILVAAFLAIVVLVAPLVAQVDVLTRRGDNLRSGVYAQEKILTHASVRTRFGKLWTLFADAKIMAQPLYVSNLVVPTANIIGATAKAKCASGCTEMPVGSAAPWNRPASN